MPGYEPFLLCDFHVHTRWSDGRLSVRDVVEGMERIRRSVQTGARKIKRLGERSMEISTILGTIQAGRSPTITPMLRKPRRR